VRRPFFGNTRDAWITALVADVVVVLVFAIVGRANHGEHVGVPGVWHVAWPFLVGVAAALAWAAYDGKDPRTLAVGARVWLVTLVLGMVLRHLAGGGTPADFVVVALLVLGVMFLGWRLVLRWRRWTSPLRALRK
jgi:hypothetical protein